MRDIQACCSRDNHMNREVVMWALGGNKGRAEWVTKEQFAALETNQSDRHVFAAVQEVWSSSEWRYMQWFVFIRVRQCKLRLHKNYMV